MKQQESTQCYNIFVIFSDLNQEKRSDLSHPVHSDNCHIQNDGSCLKEEPAYVWRDYRWVWLMTKANIHPSSYTNIHSIKALQKAHTIF